MSLYAIKNDKCEWLGWETYGDDPEFICGGGSVWTDLDKAKFYAKANGGHVVELAEKPAPIAVSEEEADMLETLDGDLMPIGELTYFIHHAEQLSEKESIKREDRLMRAYVIGWTVEKPKLWNVKVPHTKDVWYYKSCDGDLLTICSADKELRGKFAETEINHYGLQDCKKEEVTDDDD